MKDHMIELITDACLIGLPIDLLYLYYTGGWYEPNRVILFTELVLLYGLPLFALWRLFRYTRRLLRR